MNSNGYTSISRSAKTYIHQLCADNGCRLKDFQEQWLIGMVDERERERERESKESMLSVYLHDSDDDSTPVTLIYIYIYQNKKIPKEICF